MITSGLCVGDKRLEPLSPGCKIHSYPEDDHKSHARRYMRVAVPEVVGAWTKTFCHHDCSHNQLVAACNRVMGQVPEPTGDGVLELKAAAHEICQRLPKNLAPAHLDEMPARYSGRKRALYERAKEDYLAMGLCKQDASIKMFVKAERVNFEAKVNPDPRAIQFRNGKYCVVISQYLRPIEEFLYRISGVSSGVRRSRNVAKGLNQVERATLLDDKLSEFKDPVVVGLDCSRFDKHVSVEQLNIEHSVYLHCMPDKYFRWLLSLQLVNRCYSRRGMRYKVRGRRMSGDMNTALGNCIIMLIMIKAAMKSLAVRCWDVLDDGDDVLLILERAELYKLDRLSECFLRYGHEVKVETPVTNIEDVEFCQSKPVEYRAGRYKFVRNPSKVLGCAATGFRYFDNPVARPRLLKAIAECELVLNLGIPVLQSFALMLLRNLQGVKPLSMESDSAIMSRVRRELRLYNVSITNIKPQEVTEVARESFARAFGISPAEQLAVEARLERMVLDLNRAVTIPGEILVDSWSWDNLVRPDLYRP